MAASREISPVKEAPKLLENEIVNAIQTGSLEKLMTLVEDEKHSLDCLDKNGFSPVNLAVQHGQYHILEWLVEQKNCQLDRSGKKYSRYGEDISSNSLYCAAKAGHLIIVQWLVEKYQFSLEKITPLNCKNFLDYMLSEGHLDIVKWLVEEKKYSLKVIDTDWSIVHSAIIYGHLDLLKWLVEEKQFSLNVQCYDNNVLIQSLQLGRFQISKWLVDEKKFSLDVNYKEQNALLLACERGELETIKWLIEEKGFSLDVHDSGNRGPVIYAILSKKLNTVKYLFDEKHCSLDVKSSTHGTCPIHYAVIAETFDILKWLVDEKKCSLETKNKDNENILDLVFKHEYVPNNILEWLSNDKNIFANINFRNQMKGKAANSLVLYHLLINAVDEAELNDYVATIKSRLSWPYFTLQDRSTLLKETLERAITTLKESNPFYQILFDQYCLINKYGIEHIQLLLQKGLNETALELLYNMTHDNELDNTVMQEVNLTLAELLIQGNDFVEENSPLSELSDSFLTNDNCRMKRAIQAYYFLNQSNLLLENINAVQLKALNHGNNLFLKNINAMQLKARLDNILSGNVSMGLNSDLNSEEKWLPKARGYYNVYIQYKNAGLAKQQNSDANQAENASTSSAATQQLGGYTNYSCGQLFQGDAKPDDKSDPGNAAPSVLTTKP